MFLIHFKYNNDYLNNYSLHYNINLWILLFVMYFFIEHLDLTQYLPSVFINFKILLTMSSKRWPVTYYITEFQISQSPMHGLTNHKWNSPIVYNQSSRRKWPKGRNKNPSIWQTQPKAQRIDLIMLSLSVINQQCDVALYPRRTKLRPAFELHLSVVITFW